MIAELVLGLMLVGVTLYAVLGGADFGAGIWDLTAGSAQGGARMRGVIERAMGPVWEANHVWLIFVFVVSWTAFPTFFGSMMSSLWVPMAIAAFGIILRGSAFALRTQSSTLREARALGAVFACSSVIVPFAFGTVVGAIASGEVAYGNAAAEPFAFLNAFSLYIGALAVVFCAYTAAIFLTGDATRMGEGEIAAAFRMRALASGALAGLMALGGLLMASAHAEYLYEGLTSGVGLLCVLVSALAGVLTLVLIARNVALWPRFTAGAAVAAVVAGWGFAQSPFLFPPGGSGSTLTLDAAAAPSVTLWSLFGVIIFALAFIAPSLVWLFKLALRGDIEPTYRGYEQLEDTSKGADPLP